MADVVVNELLCFLTIYGDKYDRENLSSLLSGFYTLDESVIAKQHLITECEKLTLIDNISEFKKRRLNSKGDANVKVIRDILDIWRIIDCHKAGDTTSIYVAVDLYHLPPFQQRINNT